MLGVLVVLGYAAGCKGDRGPSGPAGPPGPGVLGPGIHMDIGLVEIPGDRRPVVEFLLSDDDGNPVDLADLDGNPRFTLAWIDTDPDADPDTNISKYRSYIVNDVAGASYTYQGVETPPAMASAPQASTDGGGSFETLGAGSFRYRFATVLPPDYPEGATHTLGAWATRESRKYVANAVVSFIPSGGNPVEMRQLVSADACNGCHDPLEAHGGSRRDVALCILCHTDQTIDPETGNSMEMSELIHKIHRGRDLAKKPYYVVGNRQSVNDYSGVAFPQDIRNCQKCHEGGAQSDYWRQKPYRVACGSCHDDIDFSTGENHSGGIVQVDDSKCKACHGEEMAAEFDNSVPGAHVVPYDSSFNPGLTLAITDVQNMRPGLTPSIRFTVNNKSGPVDMATLDRVAVTFGGPTADYSRVSSITIQGSGQIGTLTTNAVGDYTFAPDGTTIPPDAEGTWSAGLEARTGNIVAGTEAIRFGANNPVVDVDVADGTLAGGSPKARREVVDETKCDGCHGDLRVHGNLRTEIRYCVVCHNPWATDEARRPDVDPVTNPPQSIDMKLMVHRIHRGENLENDYTVYGFGAPPTGIPGSPVDFNEVLYPGDLRDCERCHEQGTYTLPPPEGTIATVITAGGAVVPRPDAIRTPSTAACTGCHDGADTFTHTVINSIVTSPTEWQESCSVCHGEGKQFATSEVHSF